MNEGLPDVVTFDEFKEIMFGIPKKSKHSAQDILDVRKKKIKKKKLQIRSKTSHKI